MAFPGLLLGPAAYFGCDWLYQRMDPSLSLINRVAEIATIRNYWLDPGLLGLVPIAAWIIARRTVTPFMIVYSATMLLLYAVICWTYLGSSEYNMR